MTLGDVIKVLDASLEEVEDEAKGEAREKQASTVFDGQLSAVALVSEGDKLFLRTVTPEGLESVATIIPIEASSPIIARVKELVEKGISKNDITRVLNVYGERRGLKDEVINQINRYYEGLRDKFSDEQAEELKGLGIDSSKLKVPIAKDGKYKGEVDPRKIINTQNFRITDVIGLFSDKADITDAEREAYKELKLDYQEFRSQPKRQQGILRKLLTMSGKSNYEDAVAFLDKKYSMAEQGGNTKRVQDMIKYWKDEKRKTGSGWWNGEKETYKKMIQGGPRLRTFRDWSNEELQAVIDGLRANLMKFKT